MYSFGIIAFETIFQKRVFPKTEDWKSIYFFVKTGQSVSIDSALIEKREAENQKKFKFLYDIFLRSFKFDPKLRPTFEEVMEEFKNF